MTTIQDDEIKFNKKLEALRQDWHSLQYRHLGKEKLQQFVDATPLSRLAKRSRTETLVFGGKVLLTVIVMIAINAFGSWYTPIPAAWAAVLLIDDYIGFRYLYFLPPADSVRLTLQAMRLALRRLRMMYTFTPVVIWIVITLISPLVPNHGRANIIALELIPLLVLVCFVAWRIWTRRIEEVEDRMQLFNE
ncbi:MAG TPA: hypothetical protein PLR06_09020 [Cyclobacteriaceae bacterium]|nr:hypothetical protein [Cyclobacteriaceae bacterium]